MDFNINKEKKLTAIQEYQHISWPCKLEQTALKGAQTLAQGPSARYWQKLPKPPPLSDRNHLQGVRTMGRGRPPPLCETKTLIRVMSS